MRAFSLSFLIFPPIPRPELQGGSQAPAGPGSGQIDTHRGTSSTSSSSRTRGSNFSLRSGRGMGTKARDEGCGFRGGPSRAKCTQEAALTAGGGSGLPSDPKPVFSLLQPHLHPPQGIEKDTRAPPLCFPHWRTPPGLCC